ncbi:MAG: TOBE domain-containing protein [Dehalococcoidia bacterium]
MGNEIFLYLLIEDCPFVARVDPRARARPGQDVQLVIDMAQMHAFDPTTEQALVD